MANELTTSLLFTYTKAGVTVTDGSGSVTANAGTGTQVLTNVTGPGLESNPAFSVATTAGGVVLPLGSVSVPGGWLMIQNCDATNYVSLLSGVSGTLITRILPGDPPTWIRLDPSITAPAVQAHTAPCLIRYKIFDL